MSLHPDVPNDVTADDYLYAAWRYQHAPADEIAMFKRRGLSVAAVLGVFRDEWRRYHGLAVGNRLSVVAAPGALTHKVRT